MISDDWLRRNALNQGVVSEEGLQQALERQKSEGGDLFDNLIEVRATDEATLLSLIARALNTRYVSMEQLTRLTVRDATLALLPKELVAEHSFLPVKFDADTGVLVAVAPDATSDYIMLPLLEAHGVREIKTYIGSRRSVAAAIKKLYFGDFYAFDRIDVESRDEYRKMVDMYSHSFLDEEQLSLEKSAEDAEAVQHVNRMTVFTDEELEGLSRQARNDSSTFEVDPWGTRRDWLDRYRETLKVLVNRIEMGADWRQGHSAEAARLAQLVGKRMGQSEAAMDATAIAAMLHECGKPHTPHLTLSRVAERPDVRVQASRLWDAPMRAMEGAKLPDPVQRILGALYERWDGLGLPRSLSGRAVPFGARILAAVDEYLGLLYDPEHPAGALLERDRALDALAGYQSTLFDPSVVEILKQTVTGASLRQEFLGTRATLLVVDGDGEEATGLELKLVAEGYTVISSRTSAQAARLLLNKRVDIILSEVDLEPVDGFELCEKMKKHPRAKDVPVLFLSARADAASVNRGFSLGAQDYIVKPYAFEVLLAKLRRALERVPVENRRQSRGVSGSLAEMALPDIVQILSAGRKSGALKVTSAENEGVIFFQDGRIVDAESKGAWAEEAVYELLTIQEGDFELDSTLRAGQTTINRSVEGLILEGMRRLDEQGM